MSYAVDAASKLHEKQLAAATKGQDLFVTVVEKVTDLREKAPRSSTVTGALEGLDKLVAPITKFVGSRAEVTEYVTRTAREWLALQQQFQARILGIAGVKPAAAAKPARKTAAKKTAASKTAASKTAAVA